MTTAWKVSKYEVISGPNTGKCEPEITPYLDTFHAVHVNHDQEILIRKIQCTSVGVSSSPPECS